jgi:hypothetical protein
LFFFYCLYLLFNKVGEKGRTGSAWKRGGRGERASKEAGGEMTQTMYVHMNIRIKREKKKKRMPKPQGNEFY